LRRDCPSFDTAYKSGGIGFNQGRIILVSTGPEFVPAYGRGGMKAFYESQQLQAPTPVRQVSVNAISFDEGFGSAVGTRIATARDEGWVEVDVEEKRKRDDGKFQRNARRKVDGSWEPAPGANQPVPASPSQPGTAPTGATQHWPIPTPPGGTSQPIPGTSSQSHPASQTQPA
jgi:hypothetical protein